MKTVISASRRTDIPAFYLNWLIERIKEGFVEVSNPFYPKQIKRVSLLPDDVEWIVFWSRNYGHFLKKRHYFQAYNLYFHFTILSPSPLEKSPMPLQRQLQQLEQLTQIYGAERINWRYDPLLFWQENGKIKTNFNEQEFAFLAKQAVALGLSKCTISVAHPYKKFEQRLKHKFPDSSLLPFDADIVHQTVQRLIEIADRYGLQVEACCSDFLLRHHKIKKAACINGHLLNTMGKNRVSVAHTPTREQCACTRSIDIGDYRKQPCYFGCLYCYANPKWR